MKDRRSLRRSVLRPGGVPGSTPRRPGAPAGSTPDRARASGGRRPRGLFAILVPAAALVPAAVLVPAAPILAPPLEAQSPAGVTVPTPPETRRVEVVDEYHGTEVADPYRWLENVDSEETAAWVAAQNEVTFAYLDAIPERAAIEARLEELWNYERYGVPWREGGRYFFTRNDGLQDQSVLYTLPALDAEPRILIDPNRLSEDGTVALAQTSVSPDGRYLGYGIAESGSDWRTFRVRRVEDGTDLPDRLEWIKFSTLSWTEDSRGFFYSRYPRPEEGEALTGENRNKRIYYHRVGTGQSEDVLVYETPDHPEWGFNAVVTDDGRYAVVHVAHGTDDRTRVHYLDLGEPGSEGYPRLDGEVVRLLDENDATYRLVGNEGPLFYVRTNLDAPRGRIVAIDTRSPAREAWREIVPEGEDKLEGADLVGGHLVVEYLRDAHSRVGIHSLEGEPVDELSLPTLGSVGGIRGKPDGDEMFYAFTSFLFPTTIYRYDFGTGESEVFRAPEIDFDASEYTTRQVFYTSRDGTRVPMFVTHRADLELDGGNPALLYGYGGFNISLTPGFSVANLAWLEMGGVHAVANLRGGGEYGEEWHEAGMLEKKQNVFDDFISAAEFLVDVGYTSPGRLAIAGGSNGGLLVGAVMTQRPELFGAAIPAVGVMDMLRYHEFTIGWAWVPEYGSSEDPEMFEVLHAYSPYHNLRPGTCYPATLVTTADHDDRVVPGHSFKFAARLQHAHSCDRPTLIRIETEAGHGAGTPTSKEIRQAADRWAFLVENLGLRTEPAWMRPAGRAAGAGAGGVVASVASGSRAPAPARAR